MISNTYWAYGLHLKKSGTTEPTLTKVMRRSIDAVRSRTLSEKQSANLALKSEKYADAARAKGAAEEACNALSEAAEADKRIASGSSLPLDGVPIANKDLYCTKGVQTTAGSRILKNFIPPYESTVSGNLKKAGAISLGKLNMDEFANTSVFCISFTHPVLVGMCCFHLCYITESNDWLRYGKSTHRDPNDHVNPGQE